MATVAIVYFSAAGHTHAIAEAVAEGVRAAGATANLLRIRDEAIQNGRFKDDALLAACDGADAIVFGTPTYMGGISAQLKSLIDAASGRWFQRVWKDKLAAGFTHSQGLSGDKLNALVGLMINAMQHGMLWVGQGEMVGGGGGEVVNRLSSYTGAMAQSFSQQTDAQNPPSGDRATGRMLGERVARAAARWARGK